MRVYVRTAETAQSKYTANAYRFRGQVQLQLKLLRPFLQFRSEPFRLVYELESNHDLVGIKHHDHIAARTIVAPCLILESKRPCPQDSEADVAR